MRSRETAQLRRFRRVEGFVAEHARPIAGARLDRVLAQLRSAIAGIERAAGEHDSARRQAMKKAREERSLLAELREDHMLRVSALARADIDAPKGLSRALRTPHKRTAMHQMLTAANAMVGVAAAHRRWFVSQGLEPDFVRAYRAAIADVERVAPERDALLRRQLEANAVVQLALQKGKRLVLGLDVVIRSDLRGEQTLLATWRQIKKNDH